jgi:hypothetical protein
MTTKEASTTTATLEQVQQLVDQLTPLEQVRLLEYLTPRLVRAIANARTPQSAAEPVHTDAWQEFFRIGDALAATDKQDTDTLTATVLMMRC